MATIIVSEILDALCTAVDAARLNTADRRWRNAIDAGYSWLLTQDAIEFDAERHELTFVSENATYHANGVCQCTAFRKHNACRHRAAARLVRRALELAPVVELARLRVERDAIKAAARAAWQVSGANDEPYTDAERDADLRIARAEDTRARIARAQAAAMELFA